VEEEVGPGKNLKLEALFLCLCEMETKFMCLPCMVDYGACLEKCLENTYISELVICDQNNQRSVAILFSLPTYLFKEIPMPV
jgi:hypothetical protein